MMRSCCSCPRSEISPNTTSMRTRWISKSSNGTWLCQDMISRGMKLSSNLSPPRNATRCIRRWSQMPSPFWRECSVIKWSFKRWFRTSWRDCQPLTSWWTCRIHSTKIKSLSHLSLKQTKRRIRRMMSSLSARETLSWCNPIRTRFNWKPSSLPRKLSKSMVWWAVLARASLLCIAFAEERSNKNSWWPAKLARNSARTRAGCILSAQTTSKTCRRRTLIRLTFGIAWIAARSRMAMGTASPRARSVLSTTAQTETKGRGFTLRARKRRRSFPQAVPRKHWSSTWAMMSSRIRLWQQSSKEKSRRMRIWNWRPKSNWLIQTWTRTKSNHRST